MILQYQKSNPASISLLFSVLARYLSKEEIITRKGQGCFFKPYFFKATLVEIESVSNLNLITLLLEQPDNNLF